MRMKIRCYREGCKRKAEMILSVSEENDLPFDLVMPKGWDLDVFRKDGTVVADFVCPDHLEKCDQCGGSGKLRVQSGSTVSGVVGLPTYSSAVCGECKGSGRKRLK